MSHSLAVALFLRGVQYRERNEKWQRKDGLMKQRACLLQQRMVCIKIQENGQIERLVYFEKQEQWESDDDRRIAGRHSLARCSGQDCLLKISTVRPVHKLSIAVYCDTNRIRGIRCRNREKREAGDLCTVHTIRSVFVQRHFWWNGE